MLERKAIYSIETVKNFLMPYLTGEIEHPPRRNQRVDFYGDMIFPLSDRYKTFFKKGMKCVCCGIEGQFFALECSAGSLQKVYHLNLYGVLEDGVEVLLTKDHIHPKARGGKNHISNYQPMCAICNSNKGDTI